MMLLLLWSAVALAAIYLYFRQLYSSFSSHGIKSLPTVPLLGNMAGVMIKTENLNELVKRLYFKFPEERFVVRFEFLKPVLTVRDPNLIKNIVIKDFEHFVDHRNSVDKDNDPIFGRNLLSLKGQEWKHMRAALSPAFTSSKIRNMVPFIEEVAEHMINDVKKNINDSGDQYLDLDVKDLTSRVTNDVIATCAFGLKVDSQKERNNKFFTMGRNVSTPPFWRFLVLLGYSSIPKVMKKLSVGFWPNSVNKFFTSLVLGAMQDREQKNIIRPDMIHLLMEAQKGNLTIDDHTMKEKDAGFATVEESSVGKKVVNREWTDVDLVAQAVLFLLAGFETVSTTLSFFLHEVAINPDVQERLVKEINETHAKNGGKFDYNCIQHMTYMDMVMSETLRKWPAVPFLDRQCVKDYNLGKPNDKAEKDFILRKGTIMHLPLWAIQNDPAYFPDPDKFDPERFSDENKHDIKPFTYMPFGLGPRNCIGSRFALTEVKVVVYHLLRSLEVSPCARTNTTDRIDSSTFNFCLDGGHWLKFTVRT